MPQTMDEIVEDIAKKYLRIPTLQRRGLDRLDFHDCNVVNIRIALQEAFSAGVRFGDKNEQTVYSGSN